MALNYIFVNPIVASRFHHSVGVQVLYQHFIFCFKYFVKAVLGAATVKYCWIIYLAKENMRLQMGDFLEIFYKLTEIQHMLLKKYEAPEGGFPIVRIYK